VVKEESETPPQYSSPGVGLPAVNCPYVSHHVVQALALSVADDHLELKGVERTAIVRLRPSSRSARPWLTAISASPFEFSYQRLRLAADR